jgi:hypothetical protein
LKELVKGKNIKFVICPYKKENYIIIDIANQLSILQLNKIEKDCGKTRIKNLQVIIDGYKYISEFDITKIIQPDVDKILGSNLLRTLGTFILNVEKTFLMFYYKRKKNMLKDITMTSHSKCPS